jgi:hypothetical protein
MVADGFTRVTAPARKDILSISGDFTVQTLVRMDREAAENSFAPRKGQMKKAFSGPIATLSQIVRFHTASAHDVSECPEQAPVLRPRHSGAAYALDASV